MTSEELHDRLAAISSMKDAYALAKENGYTGSMERFDALCTQVGEALMTNLNDADRITGVSMQDAIGDALDAATNWIHNNAELTREAAGGAMNAVAVTIICCQAVKHRRQTASQRHPGA